MGFWSSLGSIPSQAAGHLSGTVAECKRTISGKSQVSQQLVFRQLVLQYKTVPEPPPPGPGVPQNTVNPQVRVTIDALIKKGEDDPPLSWLELYDLEALILRVRDDASLGDEAWSIREEFRVLATADYYQAYLDSKPPLEPRNVNLPDDKRALVRRDVENLLLKLHELRLGRSLLDVIRAYTTGLTFGVTVLLIVMTACTGYLSSTQSEKLLPVLLLVITGGVFGAGLSMLQRLSQIPSKGDLVARYPAASRQVVWILTPLLSLTQGALAAIVLYFIFRAGLLKGLIFPDFTAHDRLGPAVHPPLDELLHGELPSVVEGAKLLIWAIVAGTAERLVPDLLTRLADQAKKSQLGSEKPG